MVVLVVSLYFSLSFVFSVERGEGLSSQSTLKATRNSVLSHRSEIHGHTMLPYPRLSFDQIHVALYRVPMHDTSLGFTLTAKCLHLNPWRRRRFLVILRGEG